jgi:hypothetical protein
VSAWLWAFLLTEVVEVPIYLSALLARDDPEHPFESPGVGQGGRGSPRDGKDKPFVPALLVAFGASALTHPIVWFVMPQMIPSSYLLMVAIAEAFAVLAEAAWLRAFGLRRALWWALFANAASVLVGLGLRRTFGWP